MVCSTKTDKVVFAMLVWKPIYIMGAADFTLDKVCCETCGGACIRQSPLFWLRTRRVSPSCGTLPARFSPPAIFGSEVGSFA
jgi:hypothetical protein